MYSTKNKAWFTLVEVMTSIVIVSIIMVWGFSVFANAIENKIIMTERMKIQKNAFVASEKLFELIKSWWTIDYEEYFNRMSLWDTKTAKTNEFLEKSLYWNNASNRILDNYSDLPYFYYCRSTSSTTLTNWCIDSPDLISIDENNSPTTDSFMWEDQPYGQYALQFIDYNSNRDNDYWDEDWNWDILWDDDDLNIWTWPEVFPIWEPLDYLYLIDHKTNTRIFFEYIRENSPLAQMECRHPFSYTKRDCVWKIVVKKMVWRDRWQSILKKNNNDPTYWDWLIDTWINDPEITWLSESLHISEISASSGHNSADHNRFYLFPNDINITDVKYYIYPNKSPEYAWRAESWEAWNISPYIKIKITMEPSFQDTMTLKNIDLSTTFTTTINLNNYK